MQKQYKSIFKRLPEKKVLTDSDLLSGTEHGGATATSSRRRTRSQHQKTGTESAESAKRVKVNSADDVIDVEAEAAREEAEQSTTKTRAKHTWNSSTYVPQGKVMNIQAVQLYESVLVSVHHCCGPSTSACRPSSSSIDELMCLPVDVCVGKKQEHGHQARPELDDLRENVPDHYRWLHQ